MLEELCEGLLGGEETLGSGLGLHSADEEAFFLLALLLVLALPWKLTLEQEGEGVGEGLEVVSPAQRPPEVGINARVPQGPPGDETKGGGGAQSVQEPR